MFIAFISFIDFLINNLYLVSCISYLNKRSRWNYFQLYICHTILPFEILFWYEGGIKSNATNDVNWQLKLGLHFCLFQIVKIPSLYRYTNFQFFNSILEDFLIVFGGIPLRRFNMETPNFWREVYFCQQDFSWDEGREKGHRGLDQGNRVNVLEHRSPVLSKSDATLPVLWLEALSCYKLIPQMPIFGQHFW